MYRMFDLWILFFLGLLVLTLACPLCGPASEATLQGWSELAGGPSLKILSY